jgi:hypothetical protein
MTLFGEHDVFMEFAYPMVMHTVVPKEQVLEMPLCDGSVNLLGREWSENITQFKPFFVPMTAEGKTQFLSSSCTVIHPIKFGKDISLDYWKKVLQEDCSMCTWKGDSQDQFWALQRSERD